MASEIKKSVVPEKDSSAVAADLAELSLVEICQLFATRLRDRGDPAKALPVDKDYIDNLYEGEDGNFALTDIEPA